MSEAQIELLRVVLQWAKLCAQLTGESGWLALLADITLALESAGLI